MDSPGCKKFKELFETYKKFKGKPGFAEVIQALPCAVGCSLADVYRPRDMGDCPSNIVVCNSEVNVGSMNDSTVEVEQACSAGGGDGGGGGGGGGDGGGGGGGGAPDGLVDYGAQPTLTDFRTNPKSYIPKSLDDLKQNKKAKAGAAGIGGVVMMMCCCMLILLLLISGGGGPAARRFSR